MRFAATALLTLACSRTGLDPGDLGADGSLPTPTATTTTPGDAGAPVSMPPTADAGTTRRAETTDPNCVPSAEVCNGLDDDCNGAIDDLPTVTCKGGGFSYCVAGKQSACPSRCDVCIPGSERVCFTSYCTFWGTQTCTADGRSFGSCHEHRVPSECADAAGSRGDIAKLERCCLDNGYCCVDTEDLDHDGDRSEVLGRCDDVRCD